jgi:hypothetical protein
MPAKEEHPAARHVREFLGVLRKRGEIKSVRRVRGGVAVEHQPYQGPVATYTFKARPRSEVLFEDSPTHSMLVDHPAFHDYFNRILGTRRKLKFKELERALGEPLPAPPARRVRKAKGRAAAPAPQAEQPRLELPEETPVEAYGGEKELAELIETLAESEATPARTWQNFGLVLNELTKGERALTDVVLTPTRVLLQYHEGDRDQQLEFRADKKVEKVTLPGKPKPFQVELHHGRTHSLLTKVFAKRGLHYLNPGERLIEIFKLHRMAVARQEAARPPPRAAQPEAAMKAAAEWQQKAIGGHFQMVLQKHHEAGWYLRGVNLDKKSAILTWFRRPGVTATSEKHLVDVERFKGVTRVLFGSPQAHNANQDLVYRALAQALGPKTQASGDELKNLLAAKGLWPTEAAGAKPSAPAPRPTPKALARPKPELLRRVLARHYLSNLNLTMVHVGADRANLGWVHAKPGQPLPKELLGRVENRPGAKRFLADTAQVADVDQAGLFRELRAVFGEGMTHGERLKAILARHGLLPAPRHGI